VFQEGKTEREIKREGKTSLKVSARRSSEHGHNRQSGRFRMAAANSAWGVNRWSTRKKEGALVKRGKNKKTFEALERKIL